ncbi:MAG: transcriptional regulator [Clostridiales bacterium]|nr:transcriptional regulator [Clostridiales bacterium]
MLEDKVLMTAVKNFGEYILPPFDSMLNTIGFKNLCEFSDQFGGSSIYIPTKKRMFNNCISKQILKEFNGGNYRELAKKFGVCERTIRNITAR